VLPLGAAFVAGALVAVQQRWNGDLGRSLDDPLLAALVSFGGGLLLMLVVLASRPRSRALVPRLGELVWWQRLGGLAGATLVAVGAVAVPKIGVALLTVGFVAGSTVAGLLLDRTGFVPGGARPVTPTRLLGAALCLAAIVLSAAEGLRAASPLLLVLVVLSGGLISLQQAVNGRVRHLTDATVTTGLNFVVGAAGLLLLLLGRELAVGVRADHWPGLDHAYLYLGGPLGAFFIAVAALTVRTLGVLRLGLAVTGGQLLGAVLLDLERGVAASTVAAAGLTMVAVMISGRGAR
jgi:transporter family-2 protein